MKLSRQRSVTIGFAVGLVLIILLSAEALQINASYQGTVNGIIQGNNVQSSLFELLSQLDEAEAGQRGYVITGNATFLQPYQSAVSSINATLFRLQGLVAGDANLTAGYKQLQPLAQKKLSELKLVIGLRQTQGFAAAEAYINNGIGNQYMMGLRQIISSMNDYSLSQQNQEVTLAAQQGTQRGGLTFAITIAAAGLIALSAYMVDLNLSKEEAARKESERSARRAELMQDILVHDIRNYNQISKANAELLEDKLADEKLRELVESILRAIDGSTELIQRTRLLGSALSEKKPALGAVNLGESFERALSLVRKAFPERTVEPSIQLGGAMVAADQLLDQVFINILSNSVKNTGETRVPLDIELQAENLEGNGVIKRGRYWKVTIADHGIGMPEEMKKNALSRYQGAGKGRGLGLSIVRALVVDRYSGKVELRDRVEGDSAQGTKIEFWLPSA